MFGNLTLGRPMGIRVSIHWTFWLLPLFVLLSGLGSVGAVGAGFNIAILFAVFGCVALHELGHAAAARLFGIGTKDIVLYPLGGVASLERMPRNPLQEIVIALAGPAVNVVIAVGLGGLLVLNGLSPSSSTEVTYAAQFVEHLLVANVMLVAFNMLPAFPMDGGRVLRAFLALFLPRVRATEIAVSVGTVFAVLFGVIGLLSFMGIIPGPPMLLILAVFLFLTGQAEQYGVRQEEAEREQERFRGVRLGWPVRFGNPVMADVPVDGWVFDAGTRMWTKWENGVAVARYRNPERG
jgi:Zn-dependent protease